MMTEKTKSPLDDVYTLDVLGCPFCGTKPTRQVCSDLLSVECPKCVYVGFHTHVRLGTLAITQWNSRVS